MMTTCPTLSLSRPQSFSDLAKVSGKMPRLPCNTSMSTMLSSLDDSPKNRRTINQNLPEAENSSYSQQSVLSAIERFVKSVNNMDSVVLIPSRLKDMDVNSKDKLLPPANLSSSDLYSFYNMLNEEKTELLWGPDTEGLTETLSRSSSSSSLTSNGHLTLGRKESNRSIGSSAMASEDSDSEADNESSDGSSSLAAELRHHLHGLQTIFRQLADTADYLAVRYQEEVEE